MADAYWFSSRISEDFNQGKRGKRSILFAGAAGIILFSVSVALDASSRLNQASRVSLAPWNRQSFGSSRNE